MYPDEVEEVAAENLPEKYIVEGGRNRTNVLLNNLQTIFHDSCLGLSKIDGGIHLDDENDNDNAGSFELNMSRREDMSCVFLVSDEVDRIMKERKFNCELGGATFKSEDALSVKIDFECFVD